MASHSHDHDHGDTQPVTDRIHTNSWSANLEKPEHAENQDLVIQQAVDAVEYTAAGNHVNLVTHEAHGHPKNYLYEVLADRFGDDSIQWKYIDQCGCGGHVVRVTIPDT